MTTAYALSLAAGVVGLIIWISASAASAMVDSWRDLDPDAKLGRVGRATLAFLLGFGMGGLSASYAGLSLIVSLIAAIVGGAGLVAVALILGPVGADTETDS